MGTFRNAEITANIPTVQFQTVQLFFSFLRIFYIFKVDKRKASGTASMIVVHQTATVQFTITTEYIGDITLFRMKGQSKNTDTFTRSGIISVSLVTTTLKWRTTTT